MPPEREGASSRITRFEGSVDKLTQTCTELREAIQQLQITVALQGQQQSHFTEALKKVSRQNDALSELAKDLTFLTHRLEECETNIQHHNGRLKILESDGSFFSGGRAIAAWVIVTSLAIGSIVAQVMRP